MNITECTYTNLECIAYYTHIQAVWYSILLLGYNMLLY